MVDVKKFFLLGLLPMSCAQKGDIDESIQSAKAEMWQIKNKILKANSEVSQLETKKNYYLKGGK